MKKFVVYGVLYAFGLLGLLLSFVAAYLYPIFDPNIAKVTLPMSLMFSATVSLDYLFRGRYL